MSKSRPRLIMVEWPSERIIQLIEEVRKCESIWNVHNMAYKDRELKCIQWRSVGEALDTDVNQCKFKWNSLRTSFITELKKKREFPSASDGRMKTINRFHKAMSFIEPVLMFDRVPSNATHVESSTADFKMDFSQYDDSALLQEIKIEPEESPDPLNEEYTAEMVPEASRPLRMLSRFASVQLHQERPSDRKRNKLLAEQNALLRTMLNRAEAHRREMSEHCRGIEAHNRGIDAHNRSVEAHNRIMRDLKRRKLEFLMGKQNDEK